MDLKDGDRFVTRQGKLPHQSFRGRKQMHMNSWQTEECINPLKGLRDWQRRNGVQPHNHHRDNILAIQAKSIANGLQRQMDRSEAAGALPPFTPQLSAQRICMPSLPRKSSTGGTDFLYRNALATSLASATARSRRHSDIDDKGKKWLQKDDFGEVPTYLQARKAMLAEQHAKIQRNKLEVLVPEGMRIMPDAERLEILEMLEKGKKDVEVKIQALPFNIETPGQRNRAEALTKRLREIEEAAQLFSKQTVLVEQ